MTIQHALLGLLRTQPLSGYDMKKAMLRSPLFHWSGNNNQIYRALAELEARGLVEARIHPGDAGPIKKLYTLTEGGLAELHRLTRSFPDAPELRKPFLAQLMLGDALTQPEMEALLEQYRGEVYGASLLLPGDAFAPDVTPYEAAIQALVIDNLRQCYQAELAWIERVREEMKNVYL